MATLPESQRQAARDLNQAYGAALIPKDEFLRGIKELTNNRPLDIDKVVDHEYITNKNTQLLEYIAKLKEDYKIGLLSNVGSNWIREQFLTADEQGLFDGFVFSYEVRMVKPDPRIFRLIAKKLDVALEACLLVDDVQYYCEAASSLGMKAVYYQNFQQTKSDLQKLLAHP